MKDSLARGAKSAQFFTPGDEEIELKNVSSEPKDELIPEILVEEKPFDFVPYDDKIVLKPLEINPLSDGGIYLTDKEKEPSQAGEVITVGKNVRWLKKGDIGFYQRYTGVELVINGDVYLIMNDDDLLGKQKKVYIH